MEFRNSIDEITIKSEIKKLSEDKKEIPHPKKPQKITLSTFNKNNIKKIKIHFPKLKKKFFNSYNIYRISFYIEETEYEIFRRFSDFESLRKILRLIFPCIYIRIIHKKKKFVF